MKMTKEQHRIKEIVDIFKSQREEIWSKIKNTEEKVLWSILPGEDRWSIGMHLDHLVKTMTLATKFFSVYRILGTPFAWICLLIKKIFKKKQYNGEIDNLYDREFMRAPKIVIPTDYKGVYPTSESLLNELEIQLDKLERIYVKSSDSIMGNIFLWDGPLKFTNLMIELRTIAYHEEWHFRYINQVLKELT